MTNTKRWKIALVVLCVLLALSLATLGVLAFTQTFAEQAPDVSKKYGALVLGDNTAKYSVTSRTELVDIDDQRGREPISHGNGGGRHSGRQRSRV